MNIRISVGEELYAEAAVIFVDAANTAISERDVFRVALPGGSTPRHLYSLLAADYRDSLHWSKIQIFFGDERCVPAGHTDSNYRMVSETLLSKVPIPAENVHRMKGEADPNQAAVEYSAILRKEFDLGPEEPPRFDLMLLGLGEDCHTASLFPGSDVMNNKDDLAAALYVPKLSSWRLTLTPPVIVSARLTLLLATGEAKSQAVKRAIEGDFQPKICPAQLLRQSTGQVTWLLDRAAAEHLEATQEQRDSRQGQRQR